MVRTSVKHVSWKDLREVCKDLKKMYGKENADSALVELERFDEKWGESYPEIAEKWRASWTELSVSFDYPDALIKKAKRKQNRRPRKRLGFISPVDQINSLTKVAFVLEF